MIRRVEFKNHNWFTTIGVMGLWAFKHSNVFFFIIFVISLWCSVTWTHIKSSKIRVVVLDFCIFTNGALQFSQALWKHLILFSSYRSSLMTKITSYNIQKNIIPKLSKPVLLFLSSARRLIVLFISVKVSWKYVKRFSSCIIDWIDTCN